MENASMFAIVVALTVGLAGMPTDIYQVCAWEVGTIRAEPWRSRTSLYAHRIVGSLRSFYRSIMREDGVASVDLLTVGGGKRRAKDPPSIVHVGSVITLPAEPSPMSSTRRAKP